MNGSTNSNPLCELWNHPLGAPPFDLIKDEHFFPAFEWALEKARGEIREIAENPEPPTFENTVQAIDRSGKTLNQIQLLFENLVGADGRPALEETDKRVTPMLADYRSFVMLNEALFARVKTVYETPNRALDSDEAKLLNDTYREFVRGGALAGDSAKERLKAISKELSVLMLNFRDNVLKDTNSYLVWIEDSSELLGVPTAIVEGAKERAKSNNRPDSWAFIANRVIVEAVTTFAHSRTLRKLLFEAYTHCSDRGNEYDNKEIIQKLVNLRLEQAKLLGYKSHSEFVLEEQMAGKPDKVRELLGKVLPHAREQARKEIAQMQALLEKDNPNAKIEAWDYRYYAEKIRKDQYDLSEALLEPYFEESRVKQGIFNLMEMLFDVCISRNESIVAYRDEVEVYEVREKEGQTIGLIYLDYTIRDNKHAGAWMHEFRQQVDEIGGVSQTPVIINVCNFPKPTPDRPALLNLSQVNTAFHEFGHATHGLFSKTRFWKQSGTSVATDFVELPSQILENWAFEPELLKTYAKHFQSGETIPEELVTKIINTRAFNQGFFTIEYLAAALLDLEYHTLEEPLEKSVKTFEDEVSEKFKLPKEIAPRYRSTYFQHIFAGGYSSGYYSYMWSEVLDADAFDAFPKTNKFDKTVAAKFREWVLSKGGSKPPMELYLAFRGSEPDVKPLLRRRGFLSD